MATQPGFDRQNFANGLNAKFHQGYDPSLEHTEQGRLLSAVQFERNQDTAFPLLSELASGFGNAVNNLMNGVSNLFGGNSSVVNGGLSINLAPIGSDAPVDLGRPINAGEDNGSLGGAGVIEGNVIGGSGPNSGLAFAPFSAGGIQLPSPSTSSNSPPGLPEEPEIPVPEPEPPVVPPVLVPPVLGTPNAQGNEDQPVSLVVNLTTDPDSTTVIVIGNIPSGASLSAGINNGNGTWNLTPAQLVGLTFHDAPNASGVYQLNVTATSVEGNLTAVVNSTLQVTVNGIADAPLLNVSPASGVENTGIPLSINAALVDNDGSETLSIIISGVPAGGTLSAGVNNGNGTWTLSPGQLTGLIFYPPMNGSGVFNLTISAIASEAGTTATSSTTLAVTVDGVASTPILTTSPASGDEDTAIALVINAALVVNDGSETLSIVISGVPAGAVLSAGINNGNGVWTLTSAQLVGLTITPPLNSDVDFVLDVAAISTENGHSATIHSTLAVTVAGIADMPVLSVTPANGVEGAAIALTINAALTDNDGSETLSVVIGNVPTGAVLSAGTNNGNGTWTLTAAQLSGLTITPPPNYSGVINLSVTAIASEGGTFEQVQTTLAVTVTGEASTPILSVTAATGFEDTAIGLSINAASSDPDGSEVVSILIAGVPIGATLSAGINNGDQTWTLTPAQLIGLTIAPPANSNVDFTLIVTATSSEDGTNSSISYPLPVNVIGVADTPTLSVGAASGAENSTIALSIAAALTDLDGSESLSVVISNVPSGAVLSAGIYAGNNSWVLTAAQLAGLTITPPPYYSGPIALQVTAVATENDGNAATISVPLTVTVTPVVSVPVLTVHAAVGGEDQNIPLSISASVADHDGSETISILISGVPTGATLSAGINNGNNTWTLTEAQLVGLTIKPPLNSDVDFVLTVTVTATESDGSTSSISSPLAVTVNAIADVPTVLALDASGAIDTQITINISGAVTDLDGSETLTYVIDHVPDGFAFNQGANNGDGSWTFTPAQLVGLKMIVPYHFQGRLHLTAYAVSHEAENGSVARSIGDKFTVTIGDPLLGLEIDLDLGIGLGNIGLGVGIGADVEIGNVLNVGGLVMHEDSPLLLNNISGLFNLLSALQLPLLLDVTLQLPNNALLSVGTNLGNGLWSVPLGQINNVYLIAPPNSDEDFTLTINARLLSLVSVQLEVITVHVVGVADLPSLNVPNVSATEGDTLVPLSITSALVIDTDGSETLSITLRDLPPGFTPNIGINNGDGTWTIPVALLASLALYIPAHFSGDVTYTVVATSTEREGDSTSRVVTGHIHVDGVADAPIITPPPIHEEAGSPIALNLGITLGDDSGTEHLVGVIIGNLPIGASLSHGHDNGDGTWSVNPNDIGHLNLIPPLGWHGDVNLSITATAQEANGSTASAMATLSIHLEAHADMPVLSVSDCYGIEGSPIAIGITAALTDLDGSEVLRVTIGGLSDGMTLSHGFHNGDGSWTVSGNDLAQLTLNLASNFSGDIALSAVAHSTETSNGDTASTAAHNFTVHVADNAFI